MTRTAFAIAAALGLLILPACEQEGYVPDERVEGEGVGPGEGEAEEEDGEEAAREGVAEGAVDVGGGASGEVPTEGGGLTED